jgi:hypothetical protein
VAPGCEERLALSSPEKIFCTGEKHGKMVENIGKYGKHMGKTWETYGKHMGNNGENMGNGGKIRIYCENIIEYSWEYTIMEYCTGILMDITAGKQTWLAEKSSLNGCFNKNINY